jgi:phosphoserine phosphatase
MKRVCVWCVCFVWGCASEHSLLVKAGWRAEQVLLLEQAWEQASHKRSVAVFDWDNTVIKNDIGDGFVHWMLLNDAYKQPPGYDWSVTSPWLTAQAVASLRKACEKAALPGAQLLTSRHVACAREIACVYHLETTCEGAQAFAVAGYDHRRMRPSYAWAAQLLAGYTHAQLKDMAAQAIAMYLDAPEGSVVQGMHGKPLPGYIRVYPAMRVLIHTLQRKHVETWVLSASPQPVVEVFAQHAGIAADRVVGIQSLKDTEGLYTYHLEGCGKDTGRSDQVMTYMDGKRCFMNEKIFHVPSEESDQRQLNTLLRPVLAAGDASTDVSFVRDAWGVHVVIDRHYDELMCWAEANEDARWTVSPMFIDPIVDAAPKTYACTKDACKQSDGSKGSCW